MLPDDFEASLSSYQIAELMAFETIEPAPDFYWLFSMLAYVVSKLAGNKHAKQKQFYPRTGATHTQSVQQQMAVFNMIAAKFAR